MLEVGEASGNMDEVLLALSRYYRREAGIQSALRRALIYPAVMAGLVLTLFAVMLSQVLPVFAKVFQQMGVALPPLAKELMSFGQVSVYAAGVLCVLLLASTLWFLSRRGQQGSLPLGRAANDAMDRGQFSYVMSMLLSSGLSFESGLDYTEELLHGSHLVERLHRCRQRMGDGLPFARALEESGVLTPLQASLLAAGVRTGDAERAMDEVASRCAEESEEALSHFFTRLEFALVILLCTSVGLVLLSVMLPLVGLLSAIG
jgi:type IV pilus assembly protein PilC